MPRGISHVDLSVLDYENGLGFYDRMFGWLGWKSFDAAIQGYAGVYYYDFNELHSNFASLIGIHPADPAAAPLDRDHSVAGTLHPPGLHHIGLWAHSAAEVDAFHREFLVPEGVRVTDPPREYPNYMPDYYAVFFHDPTGIRWEFVHTPAPLSPRGLWDLLKAQKTIHAYQQQHPDYEWERELPGRESLTEEQ